jgi:hypothetical protein
MGSSTEGLTYQRKPGQFLASMVGMATAGGIGVAFGSRLGVGFAVIGTIGAWLSWLDILAHPSVRRWASVLSVLFRMHGTSPIWLSTCRRSSGP